MPPSSLLLKATAGSPRAGTNPPLTTISDKCIVFDLDETLVHTFDEYEKYRDLNIQRDPRLFELRRRIYKMRLEDLFQKRGSGVSTDLWGVTRPHVKDLLVFCSSYCKHVGVWSAGQAPYVHAIVDELFRDIKAPDIVFTWDDCQRNPDGSLEKPLSQMFQAFPGMTPQNTIIIDDRPSTFARANPQNGVVIPAYEPPATVTGMGVDDPTLLQLKMWMSQPEFRQSKDVRLLDKGTIFRTPLNTYL